MKSDTEASYIAVSDIVASALSAHRSRFSAATTVKDGHAETAKADPGSIVGFGPDELDSIVAALNLGTSAEARFTANLDRLLGTALDRPLHMRVGSWNFDVPLGILQSVVASSVLVTVVQQLGNDSTAAVVLAAVLPFLLDVKNTQVKPSEQLVLTAVTPALTTPRTARDLWVALPDDLQHELTYLDFIDVLEQLERAGALRKNLDERYVIAGRGLFNVALGGP